MIISLNFGEAELEAMNVTFLEERFSEMLRSHKSGCNLLVVGRGCSRWALEKLNLINADRSVLERLNQEIIQTGGLISRAEKAIIIGLPGTQLGQLDDRLINVPIDMANFTEIIKCPVLVVEDIVTDKDIYYFLLEKVSGVPLPFTTPSEPPAHGGGERICDVARERVSEGRIVYALADSDRRAPGAQSPEPKGANTGISG